MTTRPATGSIPSHAMTDPDADATLQARIVERVITEVARVYGLDARQVTGRAQTAMISEARAMAMFLCARHSEATHAQIAQRFSGRAAPAVARAKRYYEKWWDTDQMAHGFRDKARTVNQRVKAAIQ